MIKCFAFDVDGVLFDVSRRLSIAEERVRLKGTNFWDEFFNEELIWLDTPRDVIRELITSRANEGCIIVISGRPQKLYRITIEQVIRFYGIRPYRTYLRRDGDYRQSDIVKIELIEKAFDDGLDLIEYHDDDLKVLKKVKTIYPQITLYIHEGNTYRILWRGSTKGLYAYVNGKRY